jgi:tetratricopeptide (TPR) repeat protein
MNRLERLRLLVCAFVFGTSIAACARRVPLVDEASVSSSDRARAADETVTNARALLESGDYGRAEQYAEFAARNGAKAEVVMPLILEACIRDQRFRAAVEHGQHHLKRHPSDHAVRLLLASIHGVLGEPDLARRELERVIAARPDWAQAHYALAVLLRDEIGNLSEADAHFREYLRIEPDGMHRAEAEGSLLSRVE